MKPQTPGAPKARAAAGREAPKPPLPARPLGLEALAARVEREPDNPFLRNELGNLLVEHSRLEEAADQYRHALRADDRFPVAWNNLGVTLQALGRMRAATRAFLRAIKVSPAYALAHYNLGMNYDARRKHKRAVQSYQKAIELDPGLLDVRNNPHVVSNRHLAEVLVKSYLDRGGSVLLPVQSFYPARGGRRAPSKPGAARPGETSGRAPE